MQGLARLLVHEHGQGRAPGALTADQPVGTAFDHGADAVLARRRVEGGGVDGRQGLVAQGCTVFQFFIHADEPLGRVAEDDRRLGAPAVRIGVLHPAARQQIAGLDQLFHHRAVGGAELAGLLALGLQHLQAGEQGDVVIIGAVGVHRVRHLAVAVGLPDGVVIRAVAGGGVDKAGAGVVGHMVAGQQGHGEAVARVQRRQRVGAFQTRGVDGVDAGEAADLGRLEHVLGQLVGDDEAVARLGPGLVIQALFQSRDLVQAIGDLGAVADGAVGRDGPGRGRPDHHRGRGRAEGQQVVGVAVGRADHRELDPDRGRDVVVILDLGIGQGRALDRRPHDGLGAAIQLARVLELVELGDDGRLGREVHGGVAVVEVAGDAQALELIALHVDPAGGVFTAGLAELRLGHLVLAAALGAELLLDLPLDRQAVAVPAGDVVDVIAQQEARTDHEVLQRLVQGVADVDVAVGVGRAVVQDVERRLLGLTRGAQVAVEVAPGGDDLRLLLRQPAPHGEGRLGQEDGVAIVAASCVGSGVVGGVGHGVIFVFCAGAEEAARTQSSVKAVERHRRYSIPTCAGLTSPGATPGG
ncbi:hypothetical protein D3C72_1058060 [compost metagenome]